MKSGAVVAVRVTPRGGRDAIEGVTEAGELQVRVPAAPADGAANAAVIKLVAKAAQVPRGAVTLVSGATGRHKRLGIDGGDPQALRSLWPGVSVRTS